MVQTIQSAILVHADVSLRDLNREQLIGYEWLRLIREASTREYYAHFDIGYKTA